MNKQLKTYLQQVGEQLKMLPEEKRDEELQEVRQHLESLITDSMEHGTTEAVAVQSALRQFGAAQDNGRALLQAWKRKRERPLWQTVPATALFMFVIQTLVSAVLWCIFRSSLMEPGGLIAHGLNPLWNIVFPWSYYLGYFLCGWLSGILAPQKAVRNWVLAYLLLNVPLTVFIWYSLLPQLTITPGLLLLRTIRDIIGLALSCLAAWAGARWAQQRKHPTTAKR